MFADAIDLLQKQFEFRAYTICLRFGEYLVLGQAPIVRIVDVSFLHMVIARFAIAIQ